MSISLLLGDCLEQMAELPDCSIDAIVTDPPYGLSFMGKKWDYDVPSVEIWTECLRVLKPGGHLLAFAGTRTQHRMAVRIEDAGFEVRDLVMWHYGSGFPKSLDVSKAIDKAAGAEREVVERRRVKSGGMEHVNRTNAESYDYRPDGYQKGENVLDITAPATPEAQQWSGWGTALKPATEIVTMARKPFKGTVAANVLEHGTGAINVDGCRVEFGNEPDKRVGTIDSQKGASGNPFDSGKNDGSISTYKEGGRWPANLIHDGSDEVVGLFPQTPPAKAGDRGVGKGETGCYGVYGGHPGVRGYDDAGGSAARFFYCAKTSKRERGEGNNHPTVKPIALMRYLCRLVTPPGGTVLDPFMGSGSTGIAAVREGFGFIGIERELEYMAIAQRRIEEAEAGRNETAN